MMYTLLKPIIESRVRRNIIMSVEEAVRKVLGAADARLFQMRRGSRGSGSNSSGSMGSTNNNNDNKLASGAVTPTPASSFASSSSSASAATSASAPAMGYGVPMVSTAAPGGVAAAVEDKSTQLDTSNKRVPGYGGASVPI
jgi:cell pole-organizing protein PopZ